MKHWSASLDIRRTTKPQSDVMFCCSDYGGAGDDHRSLPKVDQSEPEAPGLHGSGREMQTAAVSFGQEGEAVCSPAPALQVR